MKDQATNQMKLLAMGKSLIKITHSGWRENSTMALKPGSSAHNSHV